MRKSVVCIAFLLMLSACQTPVVPPDNWPPNGPDTTSHNFAWQIDTIGVQGVLYDVAIVNDTLAYAVGEIYLRDSTGQIDPLRYNLAEWNGNTWTLKRVLFPQYNIDCTVADSSPSAIQAIFKISDVGVLVTGGLSVARLEGSSIFHYPCVSLAIIGSGRFRKIWGASDDDFYCVGTEGTIFHFNGSSWQKIESGKSGSFRLTDVWGSTRDGSAFVVAVGSDFSQDHAVKALTPSSAMDTLGWSFQNASNTVWFSSDSPIYIGGLGLWEYKEEWVRLDSVRFFNRVRGNSRNDVFAWGGQTETAFLHFNGSTWHEYQEISISQGFRTGLSSENDMVMISGFVGDQSFVIRGYR